MTCPVCRYVHHAGIVAAVGRFRPEGPKGWRSTGSVGSPIRKTRDEAAADWCNSTAGARR